ncbi:MAG: hypothetical protein KC933_08590, partial [Myxococcales bacterium]|nr:hypothetical protein [Myxococcales bacterium]
TLCQRGAWEEARVVAGRLTGPARLVAWRHVLRAQVQAGLPIAARALSATLRGHLAQLRAEHALLTGDLRGAWQAWETITSPRLASLAAAALLETAVEQRLPPRDVQAWARRLDLGAGAGLKAQAALLKERHEWREAAEHLSAAGRAPRRSVAHWLEGARPDAHLAVAMAALTLRWGRGLRWPWSRRPWLYDSDVMRRVVATVGRSAATDPLASAGLGGVAIRRRLQQAAELARIEAIDWAHEARQAARSPEAQAFVRGLLGDEAFGRALPRDPCDPIRAFYDDGVARSASRRGRRRVLVNACNDAVAEVRLATLATLGGGNAERVLVEHLAPRFAVSSPAPSGVEALAEVSPRALVRLLLEAPARFEAVLADGSMLRHLEVQGALPHGSSEAADWMQAALHASEGVDAEAWWQALWAEFWRRSGSAPAPGLMRAASALSAEELRHGPAAVLDMLAAASAALQGLSPDAWLDRVLGAAADLRLALAVSEPAGPVPWPIDRWQAMLQQVRRSDFGAPDARYVERWVSTLRLPAPADLTERLLSGAPLRPALEHPLAIPGTELRLRLLHKVDDAFGFLRLADSVLCCFNSASRHYGSVEAARNLALLWRDPMSVGLRVESAVPPHEPRGFVFGSLGQLEDGASSLLLNGLYLTRNRAPVRASLARVLAETVAPAFGVQWLGLANRHGGYGPLPVDFRWQMRPVRRLRALRRPDGTLQRLVYDDISRTVNDSEPLGLYWRRVRA